MLLVDRGGCSPSNYVSIIWISLIEFGLFFVEEGETECTGEMGRGQFSIFGAVEENDDWGFSRIRTDQEVCRGCAAKPLATRDSDC